MGNYSVITMVAAENTVISYMHHCAISAAALTVSIAS